MNATTEIEAPVLPIVIEVLGGVVHAVYSRSQNVAVAVFDYDNQPDIEFDRKDWFQVC